MRAPHARRRPLPGAGPRLFLDAAGRRTVRLAGSCRFLHGTGPTARIARDARGRRRRRRGLPHRRPRPPVREPRVSARLPRGTSRPLVRRRARAVGADVEQRRRRGPRDLEDDAQELRRLDRAGSGRASLRAPPAVQRDRAGQTSHRRLAPRVDDGRLPRSSRWRRPPSTRSNRPTRTARTPSRRSTRAMPSRSCTTTPGYPRCCSYPARGCRRWPTTGT